MTRYEIPRLHGPTLKVRFVGGCSMEHLKIVFRYDIEKEARKEENLLAKSLMAGMTGKRSILQGALNVP